MSRIAPFLFSGVLAIASVIALPSSAQTAPVAKTATYTQVADAYSMPLGSMTITALSDGTVPQDLYQLLIGPSHSHIDSLLNKAFLANPVEASINAFVIRDGERIILVDTGSGELFGPGYGGKLYDRDRKSTRLNSSHVKISYAVFCLK